MDEVGDEGVAVLVGYVLDDPAGFHHLGPVICEAARDAGAGAVGNLGFTGNTVSHRKVIAVFVEIDRLSADIAKDGIASAAAFFINSYMHRSFSY